MQYTRRPPIRTSSALAGQTGSGTTPSAPTGPVGPGRPIKHGTPGDPSAPRSPCGPVGPTHQEVPRDHQRQMVLSDQSGQVHPAVPWVQSDRSDHWDLVTHVDRLGTVVSPSRIGYPATSCSVRPTPPSRCRMQRSARSPNQRTVGFSSSVLLQRRISISRATVNPSDTKNACDGNRRRFFRIHITRQSYINLCHLLTGL